MRGGREQTERRTHFNHQRKEGHEHDADMPCVDEAERECRKNVDWASAGAGASVRSNVSRLRTSSILASRRPRSLGFGGVVLRSCFRNKVGRSAMDEQICEAQSCGDQRFLVQWPGTRWIAGVLFTVRDGLMRRTLP
jgi:hypothetical protein